MCPHFRASPDRLCVLISGVVQADYVSLFKG